MSQKLLAVVAAVVALIAGLVISQLLTEPQPLALKAGTLLPQPRALPDIKLVDQDGKDFRRESLQGGWTLIFPGFTRCPDVCPTTLAFLKALHAELEKEKRPLGVILFSVDPERDTPAALASYVRYFHPSFKGITGPEPQLARAALGFSVAYAKVPGATPESYSMDHSAALILTNPQGHIAGFFSPPFDLKAMAADLSSLIPATP